ncbi:MAG: FAD-dependent urate hydroxylase [Pseudomonadota bacterium]|jgi:2-polyprenyl-6-methoxyphenol hydroxylase-like FAD-dependent oxidoreductase
MTTALKTLIVGGGFSGMAAAIEMRKRGMDVELVEIDAGWRSYGAGISLGGATLRAFRQLGVLDAFLREGNGADGVKMFLGNGQPIGELPTPRLAGPDVPGGGAIMRPALARILAEATRASGTTVRLGVGFEGVTQDADGATVRFSDGSTGRYDLVVGADGLYSKVRQVVFPDAPKPRYTGQAVWRAVLPRPAEVDCAMMWMGPRTKPGVNPVSRSQMYMFITEHRPVNEHVDPKDFPRLMRGLLEDFSAPLLATLREQITETSSIVFRPLEAMLMPQPWHRGRVVLIGDAVHATTPHLASGACIGIEDGLVLAACLDSAEALDARLQAFQSRRWERCRMVVENSLQLGEIEMHNGNKDEHGRIMRESLMALAQPI